MILLDTNVVSESLRKLPDSAVLEWLDAQMAETLYLSSISLAELRYGILSMPKGQRQDALLTDFEICIAALFGSRILAFDADAAIAYATLRARARIVGKAIAVSDGYIAAIAMTNRFAIATRDTGPFQAAGLEVINPWLL